MKVRFGQIYVEVGVCFPFSLRFQQRLSEEVSSVIQPSAEFSKKFGDNWSLMFRISAKKRMDETEIRGPTVFRKSKDVEFSVFLPFDSLQRETGVERAALKTLLHAVCDVLERYSISTVLLRAKSEELIESICADPSMFSRVETK